MRIRSVWLTKAAGWFLSRIGLCLTRTLKFSVHMEYPETDGCDTHPPQCYLYPIWHDSLILPMFVRGWAYLNGRNSPMSALASQHRDASYVTEFMKAFRVRPIRGSTTRGGAAALKQMLTTAPYTHVVITPDGPQGPRRELKSGIVFLASQTGMGIVPTSFTCRTAWCLKGSWTDLFVPKPWSEMIVLFGTPLFVPPDLSREELEMHRQRVQTEMDRLDAKAQAMLNGTTTSLPEPVRKAA